MRNKVELLGRLGGDPEIKTLNSGTIVANFNLATWENRKKRDSDEWEQITEWHEIQLWGDSAKKCEKYSKGDVVLIDGKIHTQTWEKDGQNHSKKIIVGYAIQLIKKGKTDGKPESKTNAPDFTSNEPEPTDDCHSNYAIQS